MIFRDESEGLSNRRQRVKVSKQRLVETTPILADSPEALILSASDETPLLFSIPPFQMLPMISLGLGTSADEQATCFFFQNYVLQQDLYSRGNFQYLSDIYDCEEVGEGLADSISSLGLVGLAHFWGASSILAHASAKYNSALMTISTQLRTIEGAKSDQTMAAIMLLGLYEVGSLTLLFSFLIWESRQTHVAIDNR